MPPISLRNAAVPSPALLRFLRAQSSLRQPGCATLSAPLCAKPSRLRQHSSLSAAHPPAHSAQSLAPSPAQPTCSLRPPAPNSTFFPPPLRPRNHKLQCLVFHRNFSSTRPAQFLGFSNPWKKPTRKSGAGPLQPNDLPQRESFAQDESGSFGRATRPTNEPRIRCTEFDENGTIKLTNSEFRKSELIAKVCSPTS